MTIHKTKTCKTHANSTTSQSDWTLDIASTCLIAITDFLPTVQELKEEWRRVSSNEVWQQLFCFFGEADNETDLMLAQEQEAELDLMTQQTQPATDTWEEPAMPANSKCSTATTPTTTGKASVQNKAKEKQSPKEDKGKAKAKASIPKSPGAPAN